MADSFKVLGQATLATSSFATIIYTVPDTPHSDLAPRKILQCVVSSIVICNRDGSTQTYNLAVVPSGETRTDKHTIISGRSLTTSATEVLSFGIAMGTGDKIVGYGSALNFSISIFGVEVW